MVLEFTVYFGSPFVEMEMAFVDAPMGIKDFVHDLMLCYMRHLDGCGVGRNPRSITIEFRAPEEEVAAMRRIFASDLEPADGIDLELQWPSPSLVKGRATFHGEKDEIMRMFMGAATHLPVI